MEIVTADDNDNPEEYDAATWLTQSKELEVSSNKLRDEVCDMMRTMGESCEVGVGRKSLIEAMKSKSKSKFIDFIALHFMNKRIVVCVKQSFKDFPLTTTKGGRCTDNPLITLKKAILFTISNTETGIRNVIKEVKSCVSEGARRMECFKTLHKRILATSVKALKSLIQLTSKGLRGMRKFSFRAILCTIQGVRPTMKGSFALGKCILCAYMPSRCKSQGSSDPNMIATANDPSHQTQPDVSEKTQEYDSKDWEPATTELEQESDVLRGDVCGMLQTMETPCNQTQMPVMKRPIPEAPKVKKNFRMRLFFSLHRLNRAFVGCLKEAVKNTVVAAIRSVATGVGCVFKPVTDVVKVTLKIILESVILIRDIHPKTTACLRKNSIMKHICLSTMTVRTTAKFIKYLMELISKVTNLVRFLSGVGLQSRLGICSVKGAVPGLLQMTMVGAQLGKCIILVANCIDDEFEPSMWFAASKVLENESDNLREDLCELMASIGEKCDVELEHDMRRFFINTQNVRKSARLYDLYALNFLNKGIVGCLKNGVKVIVSLSISTSTDAVKCVFKPLIDLVKVSLKLTLGSVMLMRHVHYETKECLPKRLIAKTQCLITLHARSTTKIVKSLLHLLRTVTKATMYIAGGFRATLTKCAMTESSKAFINMSKTTARFAVNFPVTTGRGGKCTINPLTTLKKALLHIISGYGIPNDIKEIANCIDDEYESKMWLSASKNLENESDNLRDDLCEMMTSMDEECGEKPVQDMRTFFIRTENIRKSAKLYDLFALNFLNKGIVGCLKNVVKTIASLSISSSTDGVKCVSKPLIDLVKVSLKLTSDSVRLVRHVHYETKKCLTKKKLSKIKCLITLHTQSIMQIIKSLVELLKTVTKATAHIAGGFIRTLTKCSMSESSKAFKDMSKTTAKFGKCIYCTFTQRCSDSN
ncbi:hypothetical protein CBL_03884 [Carabus blaptoides fortunei]